MGRLGRWTVTAVAALLVTSCHTTSHHVAAASGKTTGRVTDVAPPGPDDTYARLHSPTRAHALAEVAVEAVPLPPGSTVVATPARTIEQLGGTMILSRADGLRTWRVPGSGEAAVAWLVSHPPTGERFFKAKMSPAWPAELTAEIPGSHDPPIVQTTLRVTPEEGYTEVFADATVLWTPARTAVETIPAAVKSATLDFVRPRQVTHEVIPGGHPPHRDVVRPAVHVHRPLTAPEVAVIAGVLNAEIAQPPSVPEMPPSCAMGNETATLTLSYEGHRVVLHADLEGCHDITVTADGKAQPTLDGGSDLGEVLRPMVGLPADQPALP